MSRLFVWLVIAPCFSDPARPSDVPFCPVGMGDRAARERRGRLAETPRMREREEDRT